LEHYNQPSFHKSGEVERWYLLHTPMSGAALGYDEGFSLVKWIPSHAFRESRPLTHYHTINHHFISQARSSGSSASTSYPLQCQEQHSDTTRDFHWSYGFQVMHFASRDLLHTTINHHFISQARSSGSSASTSYPIQCQEQHSDTTRDFHWSNGFQVMHFASRDLLHTIIQSTIIS
jgi:hypothetical protein